MLQYLSLPKDLCCANAYHIIGRVKNMKRKIVGIFVCMLLAVTVLPTNVTANETTNVAEPILKVDIGYGYPYPGIEFIVRNIGDATAHNVTFTDVNISGDVVYNNRGHISDWNYPSDNITLDIEPGNRGYGTVDSWVVGFGVFSVIITVTCDEGTFYSDKTYGLIFGPFIFIL